MRTESTYASGRLPFGLARSHSLRFPVRLWARPCRPNRQSRGGGRSDHLLLLASIRIVVHQKGGKARLFSIRRPDAG